MDLIRDRADKGQSGDFWGQQKAPGDATENSSSASIDSDIDGKGGSLLVINTFIQHDQVSNPSLDPALHHLSVHSNSLQLEIYKGNFSIDGNLTGSRSNGGQ